MKNQKLFKNKVAPLKHPYLDFKVYYIDSYNVKGLKGQIMTLGEQKN
jgi:hypothetical protein